MLKVAVLVSGGGTNLQAILDAIDSGKITNTEIRVVISNNEGAYALERAKNYGTEGLLLSPKSFETREEFNQKLLEALKEREIDLVVLAGYLVVVPPCVIQEYENRIINIHPSLIPSFCGKGCYGLHVHEKACHGDSNHTTYATRRSRPERRPVVRDHRMRSHLPR